MTLKAIPYDAQAIAIKFHVRKLYTINGFEMGLGKTLIAIALALQSGVKKVLVVCPASLIPNWESEIEKFFGGDRVQFTLTSYHQLKKQEKCFAEYGVVVCDEVHYLKNLETKWTKLAHKLLKKHRPKYFIGLSGTPIKNNIPEWYSLLKLCFYGGQYPEFEPYSKSKWSFYNKFTHRRVTPYGVTYEGLKNVAELKALIAPVYIRRRAKDVLDLPQEIEREIIFSDRHKTDSLLETAWNAYQGKKQSKSFASGKAISALAKVEYTVDFVKENLDQMEKVLIFTDHRQSANKLHNELLGSKFVVGSTPAKKRQEYVDQLNSGEIKILIATIGSLSTGVNVTGASHTIFNDYPWVPADIDQAKKRTHRIGQDKTCFYYYILASKVDRYVLKKVNGKRKILEALEDEKS